MEVVAHDRVPVPEALEDGRLPGSGLPNKEVRPGRALDALLGRTERQDGLEISLDVDDLWMPKIRALELCQHRLRSLDDILPQPVERGLRHDRYVGHRISPLTMVGTNWCSESP